MILLSLAKIDEIKNELKALSQSLQAENEEQSLRGGPMDSFKEAAAFSVSKQAKESRIGELESILKDTKELPEYIQGKKIIIGKWSVIKSKLGEKRYRLVDPVEANPSQNLISADSPLGKVLSFKEEKDQVQFNNDLISIIKVE